MRPSGGGRAGVGALDGALKLMREWKLWLFFLSLSFFRVVVVVLLYGSSGPR